MTSRRDILPLQDMQVLKDNLLAGQPAFNVQPWLRCPLCKGELVAKEKAFDCERCRRTYPVVLGIPDFRVYPDPYISIEVDHHKGRQVQEQAGKLSFPDLLRFYWEHVSTPPTPIPLRERFIRHVLTDEQRIQGYLDQLGTGDTFLDVGCGAAALVKVEQSQFRTAIGCDVAFRWLILARKRLQEAGLPVNLVCCCADYLPFSSGLFDTVTAVSLLEHTGDAPAVVKECARVTKNGGRTFILTTNRFSIAPEPHVRVWGVGFLPRSWMPAYVKWRRGIVYEKKRLLSIFELRRFLKAAAFDSISFSFPVFMDEDVKHAGVAERFGARVFCFLSKIPLVRGLLQVISPVIQALATRKPQLPG